MKKFKPSIVILVFFFFQLIVAFVYEHMFEGRVRSEIAVTEQRMREGGVPPEQRQDIASALRGVQHDTSSYVQGQTMALLLSNALTLIVLHGTGRKHSRIDEA